MWVYDEKAFGCLAVAESFSLKTYLKQCGRWNDVPKKTKIHESHKLGLILFNGHGLPAFWL